MDPTAAVAPPPDRAWREVLDAVGSDADLGAMAEEFVQELRARGTYHHGLIPEEELLQTARLSLRALVDLIRQEDGTDNAAAEDGPDTPRARRPAPASDALGHGRRFAEDLGRSRARAGVPVEALLEAVRLDFVVLWRRIRTRAGADGSRLIVEHTESVLRAVETYLTEVQRAFLAERSRLQRDARLATERVVHLLLHGEPSDERTLTTHALHLGIRPEDTLEALVSHAETAAALEERLTPLLLDGRAWGQRRGQVFCAFRVRSAGGGSLRDMAEGVGGLYLPRLAGPAELRAAVRGAEALLAAMPAPASVRTPEEVWEFGAASWLRATAPEVLESLAEGWRTLPESERAVIAGTARRYLETGSVKATAEALYCHRNTVVNRLRALREATGLDATVPCQAALTMLLLADMEASGN